MKKITPFFYGHFWKRYEKKKRNKKNLFVKIREDEKSLIPQTMLYKYSGDSLIILSVFGSMLDYQDFST